MKKFLLLISLLFFTSCSYFQVKNAIKEADNGNYIVSLKELNSILNQDSEDKRALEAFKNIYPIAKTKYYNELNISKNNDIITYTKNLLNLLRIEEIYFSLPDLSRKIIAVIEPPINERDEIKNKLSENFFILGDNARDITYDEKLRKFAYFSEAKKYDLNNNPKVNKRFESSKKEAVGRFYLKLNNYCGDISFGERFKKSTSLLFNKYPLFSLEEKNNSNLFFNITLTNLAYFPPKINVQSGIDSYTDRVTRKVMKKVIKTDIENGKIIERVVWVPSYEDVEVEIYYRYNKYTKVSKVTYDLSYELKEKNNNLIDFNTLKISFEDSVTWTEYYPLHPFVGGRPFGFPISEFEANTLSKDELMNKAFNKGIEKIDSILKNLDSNRIINW